MKEYEYDLAAIGGGTAGLVSAVGARYLGARSALLEKEALGGDCLWTGCVPSKALIASARLAHSMRHAPELGLEGASPDHAFAAVMERMRAARARVAHHDAAERFIELGMGVHLGAARFLSPGLVEVEGVGRVRARRFVVATGAGPALPPIPGLREAEPWTYESVFGLSHRPDSLLVLGAGPIGLELGQVFARLGTQVTVVEMADEILPHEDPEAAETLRLLLEGEGVRFRLSARAEAVEHDADGTALVLPGGERVRAERLLVAVGRQPVTGGLDLERAGVETEGGAVRVDARLRTTAKGVWAAGDVTGHLQFTHAADHMARVALRNALLPFSTQPDFDRVPRVTYTDPELAHIGLSELEARARGAATHRYDFADLDRAIVDGSTPGFVKVHADRKGRILGATVVAHAGGDLVLPLVLARTHGLKLGQIAHTVFPYPTMMEGVKRTADAYNRTRLDGVGGRVLRKVVSWLA